uniref:Serum amyloid A protein n=2 Tax=Caenorhabditis tropicalis TaxID=1561998 RepID=A0A1I7TJG4_9PELO
MNSFAILLAFAMLFATALAGPGNRYGWPSSYERFLERQGVWDYNKHEVRSDYRRRGNYERDLRDLFDDWKRQTQWGGKGYRSNRFQQPTGGFSRYGFPGGK